MSAARPWTKVVRAVMRRYGKDSYEIWNNKRKRCYTVKCYRARGKDADSHDQQLITAIRQALAEVGLQDPKVYLTDYNCCTGAIIVSVSQ